MSSKEVNYQSSSAEVNREHVSMSTIPEQIFQVSIRSNPQESSPIGGINSNGDPTSTITAVQTSESDREDIILCMLFKKGKLGAAYLNTAESELFVIEDIVDLGPEFGMMRTLYSRIKPLHTITIGQLESHFIKALIQVSQSGDDDSLSTLESPKSVPPNIQLLKHNEYSYESCLHAIKNLSLPGEPQDATDEERFLYLNTLINFERKECCHALGALLMFLNKYWGILQPDSAEGPKYLNVNMSTVQDVMLMDQDTFLALQIFNSTGHPANFKRGEQHDNKEGLSIFKLFSRCRSTVGKMNLRTLLLQPTNNLQILRKRQEFIHFCLQPVNNGIVKGLTDALKKIYNLTMTLTKIHGNTARLGDWKKLYSTLHNILIIQQICCPYAEQVALFKDLGNSIDKDIYIILQTIMQTIDFDNQDYLSRITIKPGVDEELDTRKRYREELREKITLAASVEINNLPNYISNCSIVYIPEIGYLVAIQKWAEDANYQDLETCGLRHYFTLGDKMHFKSPLCDDLDKCLGDIHNEITAFESKIILRLAIHVVSCAVSLKKPLKLAAHFDSLICLAEVAKELNYIRPILTEDNIIEIEEGRHPLLEHSIANYVPNGFLSGGEHSRLKILTGPNASGKSIYLKQTGLVVYLAHIGSYVPAKSATIGLMNGIHSRIQSVESISNEMSSFILSLRQMSQALMSSEKNSLILIDEFGKGTAELDGLALLTSFLKSYLLREEFCPHVIVSTHYLHLTNLLPESSLVEHFKPNFKQFEDKIVFLYKIVKGVSSSFAFQGALLAGLSPEIIARSKEVLKMYQEGTSSTVSTDT